MLPPDPSSGPAPKPPVQAVSASGGPRPRYLVVKFGSIGDVIMAIPGAAALHAAGYAVDWVASAAVAPVLRLYPWIHVLAVDEPTLLRGSRPRQVRAMAQLWRALRARAREGGRYDCVATLYYDRRYRLLTAFAPARRRLHLSRTDRRLELLPGRHHVDEYARILLGRPDAETASQLAPVPPPTLPRCSRPAQAGRPRVVLVPAGARNALRDDALRRWPIDHYVTLAATLLQQGCEVVLAGGPDDGWASSSFAELARTAEPDAFADLIGKLSLVETLSLLDSAAVTVTHDTGPLHLAGITSTAILTIFGPTDPHGRLPRRENAIALWGGEGYACRPCYDGRDYAPCPHNGCMAQVTPGLALTQVHRLLRARAEGRPLLPEVLAPAPAGFVQLTEGDRS